MSDFQLSSDEQNLILKCFGQPLTETEAQQLADLLRHNRHARAYYLDAVEMHVELGALNETAELIRRIFEEFPLDEATSMSASSAGAPPATRAPQTATPSQARRLLRKFVVPYAALACYLCLGCGIGIVAASAIYQRPSFSPLTWGRAGHELADARVTATHNCQWQSSDSPETLPTRSLMTGQQIRIEEGLLQIVYRDGLSVLLEGPAVYEVRSSRAGKLYTGKLSITAPHAREPFVLETRKGAMQIFGGRFGVESNENGKTTYASVVDQAQVELFASDGDQATSTLLLKPGEVVGVQPDDSVVRRSLVHDPFVHAMPAAPKERYSGDVIVLGNLFDDSTSATLAEAMATDRFQAAGETIDLGVAAVRDGGLDVDFPLVDGGVWFNLVNVGGAGHRVRGLPSNDTFRSVDPQPIQTQGNLVRFREAVASKLEDGIGMSANEMMTFDLDELRAAGG